MTRFFRFPPAGHRLAQLVRRDVVGLDEPAPVVTLFSKVGGKLFRRIDNRDQGLLFQSSRDRRIAKRGLDFSIEPPDGRR